MRLSILHNLQFVFKELNSETKLFWSFMGLDAIFELQLPVFYCIFSLFEPKFLSFPLAHMCVHLRMFQFLQRCMHKYYSVMDDTNRKWINLPGEWHFGGGRRAFFQQKPHINIWKRIYVRFNLDGDCNRATKQHPSHIVCHWIYMGRPLARKLNLYSIL